jgi:hypothetical protein
MLTMHVRLDADSVRRALQDWYNGARVNDTVVITIPSRACEVRLIHRPNRRVYWWPYGGRGMTAPLEDAARRLQMLCSPREA